MGFGIAGLGFRVEDVGLWFSGFRLRKGESGEGKEAPIFRLIMASLREIPTDLIVIARGGM